MTRRWERTLTRTHLHPLEAAVDEVSVKDVLVGLGWQPVVVHQVHQVRQLPVDVPHLYTYVTRTTTRLWIFYICTCERPQRWDLSFCPNVPRAVCHQKQRRRPRSMHAYMYGFCVLPNERDTSYRSPFQHVGARDKLCTTNIQPVELADCKQHRTVLHHPHLPQA